MKIENVKKNLVFRPKSVIIHKVIYESTGKINYIEQV